MDNRCSNITFKNDLLNTTYEKKVSLQKYFDELLIPNQILNSKISLKFDEQNKPFIIAQDDILQNEHLFHFSQKDTIEYLDLYNQFDGSLKTIDNSITNYLAMKTQQFTKQTNLQLLVFTLILHLTNLDQSKHRDYLKTLDRNIDVPLFSIDQRELNILREVDSSLYNKLINERQFYINLFNDAKREIDILIISNSFRVMTTTGLCNFQNEQRYHIQKHGLSLKDLNGKQRELFFPPFGLIEPVLHHKNLVNRNSLIDYRFEGYSTESKFNIRASQNILNDEVVHRPKGILKLMKEMDHQKNYIYDGKFDFYHNKECVDIYLWYPVLKEYSPSLSHMLIFRFIDFSNYQICINESPALKDHIHLIFKIINMNEGSAAQCNQQAEQLSNLKLPHDEFYRRLNQVCSTNLFNNDPRAICFKDLQEKSDHFVKARGQIRGLLKFRKQRGQNVKNLLGLLDYVDRKIIMLQNVKNQINNLPIEWNKPYFEQKKYIFSQVWPQLANSILDDEKTPLQEEDNYVFDIDQIALLKDDELTQDEIDKKELQKKEQHEKDNHMKYLQNADEHQQDYSNTQYKENDKLSQQQYQNDDQFMVYDL